MKWEGPGGTGRRTQGNSRAEAVQRPGPRGGTGGDTGGSHAAEARMRQGNQAALSRGSYASCHRPEGELSVCGTRGRSYYSLLQLQRTSSDNAHSKCAAVPVKLLMDIEIWIHITSVQREILF